MITVCSASTTVARVMMERTEDKMYLEELGSKMAAVVKYHFSNEPESDPTAGDDRSDNEGVNDKAGK
jgi:hypothetical protein